MQKIMLTTLLFLLGTGLALSQEVFVEDFQQDPGWTSTRPDLVYWDETQGYFHTRVQDDGTQYYGISPAFPVVEDSSFVIEFDVNPVQTGWGTYPDLIFKHESEGLHRTREDRTNQVLWDLVFEVHWDDYNYKRFMVFFTQGDNYYELPRSPTFQENRWYHHRLAYDLETETLSWTVTDMVNGETFHEGSFVGCRIGAFSQIAAGHQGVQPHYGYGRWGVTLFDNIRVETIPACVIIPETGLCNQAPNAVDKVKTVIANTSRFVNVAVLDSDPDDNLYYGSVEILQYPTHGELIPLGYGAFTYNPDPDYVGTDSIVYRICDWLGLCDEATVTLNIIAEE